MRTLLLLLMLIFVVCCNSDDNNTNTTLFNAKVLELGADCGDAYLIEFNANAQNIPSNTTDDVFYEINLPEQYKVNNLDINVIFRIPTDSELMSCTTQGNAYPQIYIESVVE